MTRVLLLAATTGYQVRAFGEAADGLGIELVYATDRCGVLDDPWQDAAVPVRFHDDEKSLSALLGALRERPVDGVLAVGDRPTLLAARVSEALGVPGHSVAAVTTARSKRLTRERLRDAGLPVPWFRQASIDDEPGALASHLTYPCVLKPVALSGSRGVMRADSPDGFAAAFDRLRALLRSPDVRAERSPLHDQVLVEGFIPGREFAIEGLMTGGRLDVLAIFDKPDPLDGPFFEETMYVTPSSAPEHEQRAMVAALERAVAAIGLAHGPIHAECRVNTDGVYMLEIAARPIGGLCARSLTFRGDRDSISFEQLLLRHAIGEPVGHWTRERPASGVMMIPIPRRGVLRGVSGMDAAAAVRGVTDVRITAKADQVLVPLPEGASYLGFIFASGDRAVDVERALRASHAALAFVIDAEVPVVQSPHG